jgi:protease-4
MAMKIRRSFFIPASFLFFLLTSCMTFNIGSPPSEIEELTLKKGSADKILLINIDGAIFNVPQKNAFGMEVEAPITARIKDELTRAEADKSVKAVLLKIDSPGGEVTTCDIIRDEIVKFKHRTGVVVVAEMGDIAASGGVYISTSADKIIAHPTTVTGSIGVIMEMVNAKDLFDKIGVKSEVIKSGEKKDMGSPFRPMSVEEKALFQEVITSLYERFLSVIVDGRKGIDEKKLREIADGRVFVAQRALEYGLIDQIGYDDDAVLLTEKTAKIGGATIVTYSHPGRTTSNIYSKAQISNYGTVNLVNIQMSFLKNAGGASFLYMMK